MLNTQISRQNFHFKPLIKCLKGLVNISQTKFVLWRLPMTRSLSSIMSMRVRFKSMTLEYIICSNVGFIREELFYENLTRALTILPLKYA